MKKFLFIISLIVGLVIFFPLNKLAESYLNRAINDFHLDLTYKSVKSSLFHTTVKDIFFEGIKLDKVEISHNPFNWLFHKKILIKIYSDNIKGNIVYLKDKIKFKNIVNLTLLERFVNTVKLKGEIDIDGYLNFPEFSGKFNIFSKSIFYKSKQWGDLKFKNIESSVLLKNNILRIRQLSTQGIPVSLKGSIKLNLKNIYNSRLNLRGDIDFAGTKNKFKIKGNLRSPHIR